MATKTLEEMRAEVDEHPYADAMKAFTVRAGQSLADSFNTLFEEIIADRQSKDVAFKLYMSTIIAFILHNLANVGKSQEEIFHIIRQLIDYYEEHFPLLLQDVDK